MQKVNLTASNVSLWWPNGHGPSTPTLHTLTTTLTLPNTATNTTNTTTITQSIGFKTFEFVGSVGNFTERWGEGNASLWFRINGAAMYAKGHNWMPSEVLVADDMGRSESPTRLCSSTAWPSLGCQGAMGRRRGKIATAKRPSRKWVLER